ncbi:MAG: hypothetical protein RIA65_15390, partial [Woeseia sp.]
TLFRSFGVFGPPTIIFFDNNGLQRNGFEVVGYMKAPQFSEHVRQAVGSATAMTAQTTTSD